MLREILRRYKVFFSDEASSLSLVLAGIFFFVSLVFNFYAGVYATSHASNYVEDIVLSNIPVFNVGYIFIWGAVALIVLAFFVCFVRPERGPFVLHALSLFYFVRGFFVSLTHLAPYPTQAQLHLDINGLFAKQFGGGDFFFSAHTGVPFMLALIFWDTPSLRYIFLAWTVLFGVIVLLGHLHYSIDVLSAIFITYTLFCIAKWLFPRDYALFNSSTQ